MGNLKVWWVLGGSDYYPSWDNFLDSFETQEEAIEFSKNHRNKYQRKQDWYHIINISNRIY